MVQVPERQHVDVPHPRALGALRDGPVDRGALEVGGGGAHGDAILATPVASLNDAAAPVGPARALVIPMCNEVARIEPTLAALAASPLAVDDLELVLVDDGSVDDTVAVATAAAARLGLRAHVLPLGSNHGKGAAVRAGMLAATAKVRVFVDADLCVEIKDLLHCFEVLEGGAADVAYGTRAHPESAIPRSQPAHRIASGRAYNLLLRGLGLTGERDTQCGMKGFTAEAAEAVFGPLRTVGFGFDVEALARAHRGGWRIEAVPVTWSHLEASRVRPLRDGLSMGWSALVVRQRLAHEARHPARQPHAGARGGAAMAEDAFTAMAAVERDHWWFRAKRALVADVAAGLADEARTGPLVDVGCGTGALVEEQQRQRPVVGLELDEIALDLAVARLGRGAIVRASAEHLPIRDGAADLVTALDVVEHLDDDVAALRELGRVAGTGLVVVSVPAYRWAWSEHDVRLGHRRRYTRRTLCEAAEAAGLDVVRCTHFHSWLALPALLLRRTPLRALLRGSAEEASYVHPKVNALLCRVAQAERRWLRRGELPFGLSILLVARPRPGAAPK
jgi:dolichyl-phosphate beta-glucosyltransferase